MHIYFNKDYKDEGQWVGIVLDFLEVLSNEFGYTIDEYDMSNMVISTKLYKIGRLLNEGEDVHHEYHRLAKDMIRHKESVDKLREADRSIYETLIPKVKFYKKDSKNEDI